LRLSFGANNIRSGKKNIRGPKNFLKAYCFPKKVTQLDNSAFTESLKMNVTRRPQQPKGPVPNIEHCETIYNKLSINGTI
jgi:hypothetical protein